MGHYKANLRDIEFTLFEVLGRRTCSAPGPYAEVDEDTAREILARGRPAGRARARRVVRSTPTATRRSSTRRPTRCTLPESFKKSYQAYVDAECGGWTCPRELGGTVVPPSLRWAVAEFVLGANPAVHMYSCGYAFAHIDLPLGTDGPAAAGPAAWSTAAGARTMVLTEPDAGSDVGAGRTKAVAAAPTAPGTSTGVKRFITSGEHDMTDNIVHLVLARPEGAGPGTKGLSLFIVPKFHVDLETGELGERNGVFVTNVEHKMGLKVSTTCELTFGEVDGIPAVGWPARRRARRHRADVPDHRVRPDDGRHQGDRDAVHRLPQRARLRQGAASRAPT